MSGDFTRSNCCCLVNMQLAVFKLHCCWQLFLSFYWHSSALHQTIWSVLYIAWAMIPCEYAILVGDLYAYQGSYYQYNVYNLLQILENFGKFLNFKIAFAARGVLACLESSKIVLSPGFCAGSRWVSLRRSPGQASYSPGEGDTPFPTPSTPSAPRVRHLRRLEFDARHVPPKTLAPLLAGLCRWKWPTWAVA